MKYQKSISVSGGWAKASELETGTRAKIVSETTPTASQFENKDGSPKMQDVAKVRFEGKPEPLNVSLNRATVNALIDCYGDDSKDWINKYLTVHTEKMNVAGKRVVALYLIPEGYELKEDEGGYLVIVNSSKQPTEPAEVLPEEDPLIDIPF